VQFQNREAIIKILAKGVRQTFVGGGNDGENVDEVDVGYIMRFVLWL
jgi:hypothetical protein